MVRRVLGIALLSFALGCGAGEGNGDEGTDRGPGLDVPVDVPADVPADAQDARDAGPEVVDAIPDATPDGSPDVPADLPGDVADPVDAGDAAALPDAPDAPDTPDVPAEYPWAAGCEGTGTGAAWTLIPDATFPRGPLVQMSDRDTVTILWRTATPLAEEGCVDYAAVGVGAMGATACGPADANGQYEVALEGLPAATEFTYRARVGAVSTGDLTFRTMPDRPVPMKFAVFADAHNDEEKIRKFVPLALAEGVDFAIGVGDLTGEGLPEEFDITLRAIQDLGTRVNVWTVLGNHDEKHAYGYFEAFAMPQGNEDEIETGVGEGWWARRIGNVWLGGGWIRDFYLSTPDADWGQVGWFRRQFETQAFRTAQWKLFFIHQPPYTTQWGDSCEFTGENCLRVALVPLVQEFGIQAMFHGHMHGIEWGQVAPGVHSFIAGGLGSSMDSGLCPTPEDFPKPWNGVYGINNFAIVEAGCDRLLVRWLDLDGNEVARAEVPASTEPAP